MMMHNYAMKMQFQRRQLELSFIFVNPCFPRIGLIGKPMAACLFHGRRMPERNFLSGGQVKSKVKDLEKMG
jgi:hypothetical protein